MGVKISLIGNHLIVLLPHHSNLPVVVGAIIHTD